MTVLVGAGSKPALCDNDYILLILGGFGTRPYEVGYLGSPFSKRESSAPAHTFFHYTSYNKPKPHTPNNNTYSIPLSYLHVKQHNTNLSQPDKILTPQFSFFLHPSPIHSVFSVNKA